MADKKILRSFLPKGTLIKLLQAFWFLEKLLHPPLLINLHRNMQILNNTRLLTQSHNAKRGDVELSFTSPAVSERAETEEGPGARTRVTSSGERGGAGEPDR